MTVLDLQEFRTGIVFTRVRLHSKASSGNLIYISAGLGWAGLGLAWFCSAPCILIYMADVCIVCIYMGITQDNS